ncbi:MAG: TIM barrel protein [Burkholderiaceae bacterium]|nr:TIM barrel protein [Microbacteriaceae bacterium]
MSAVRIAAAPISWGVCEVPGWGLQLSPDRVLGEMADLGFSATEFGPEGFLPRESGAKAATLRAVGLTAVGGFVPAILHVDGHDPLPAIALELDAFEVAGADVLVVAAATGVDGYDAARPVLDEAAWTRLLLNLDAIDAAAGRRGITAVIHPHVGTIVENPAEISRVLEGSSIGFCLDTGHLLIGGTDPVDFALRHSARIRHTHLKDVDLGIAALVRDGALGYYDAVTRGLYRALGRGDIDIRSIVTSLMSSGYSGWFVLEQDNVVVAEPAAGAGPMLEARASIDFLRSILADP